MKKINKIVFKLYILLVFSIVASGCSNYLDVNVNPDSPSDAQISPEVILPGMLANLTYELAGGYPARAASLWTSQIAVTGQSRSISTLFIDDTDTNNTWQYSLYTGILKAADNMIKKAEVDGNTQYIGIGKIVQAYGVSILADFWGNAPWTEAFDLAIPLPKFDDQESLYASIDKLLSDAEASLNTAITSGLSVNNDLLYNGDLSKWVKLSNSLRARYAMRLIYAKGVGQADVALSYIEKGFTSNSDDAGFGFEDKEDANNPWAQWHDKWNKVFINQFLVDMLSDNSDPRLDGYALNQNTNTIVGSQNGTVITTASSSMVSIVKSDGTLRGTNYFVQNNSNIDWMTYNELLFIAAEAYAFKEDYNSSETNLRNAVRANLEKIIGNGVINMTADEVLSFVNALVLPTNIEGAQKMIIEQKYIANFLQIETYNDYRRTGYPELPLPVTAFSDQIPERFPYSTDPLLNNEENVPIINYQTDKVWWDQK